MKLGSSSGYAVKSSFMAHSDPSLAQPVSHESPAAARIQWCGGGGGGGGGAGGGGGGGAMHAQKR